MSEVLRETLLDQGRWFRAEAEQEWNPRIIHPNYRFDEENISYGFCGVTSAEQARRLGAMSLTVQSIVSMLDSSNNDEASRVFKDIFELTQYHDLLDETKGLIGAKAFYAYGLVEANEDIISDDHCWVVVKQEDDIYDLDETGDQFNVEGLNVPPVVVQRSREYDGYEIRHIPKVLEPIETFDTSRLAKRLGEMKMYMPGWRSGYDGVPWDWHKSDPNVVNRYEELKKQEH